jgi:glyoxylase-like metal-dependent hydrolase (beta-lactamase superfamily II)
MLVPIPGHTPGSIAVLYREKFLFTGDSLFWSEPLGHLMASRLHTWHDWRMQQESLKTLLRHKVRGQHPAPLMPLAA